MNTTENRFKTTFDNWPILDGSRYIEADLGAGVTVRATPAAFLICMAVRLPCRGRGWSVIAAGWNSRRRESRDKTKG